MMKDFESLKTLTWGVYPSVFQSGLPWDCVLFSSKDADIGCIFVSFPVEIRMLCVRLSVFVKAF